MLTFPRYLYQTADKVVLIYKKRAGSTGKRNAGARQSLCGQ